MNFDALDAEMDTYVSTRPSSWFRVQQDCRLTDAEKDARLQATMRERERLEVIENEKKKQHVHCQVQEGLKHRLEGFDYNKIPLYTTHGIWIDGLHFFVAAPEITTPHYMSVAGASTYLFEALGFETVHTFSKWNGEKLIILRLTDDFVGRSIYVYRDKAVYSTEDLLAAQIELMPAVHMCVAGSLPPIQSPVLTTWTVEPGSDGIIVSTAVADYRIKEERTYDFLVHKGKLVDKDGKEYGFCTRGEGSIVEVDASFHYLKDRPDKVSPLTTTQVDQVTKSVIVGTLPAIRSHNITHTYETIVAVAYRVAQKLCLKELFWTQDAVAGAIQYSSPYSKEEVYCAVAPFILPQIRHLVKRVGKLGITREGPDVLVFSEPQLRKLTTIDFVEEAVRSSGLTQLKRKLINDGWVFTPADFRILREVFFRGYKNKFVLNVGYVAHCYSLIVAHPMMAVGESDLPYIGRAVAGQNTVVTATKYYSPFLGYKVESQPLLLRDLAGLPDQVYYSDLADLVARTGKLYDEVSIGPILRSIGKQLVGARPWRLPTIVKFKEILVREMHASELSKIVGVPVPYLLNFIEQHLDIFEITQVGKLMLRQQVNHIEGT